jgi:hypothetical protein
VPNVLEIPLEEMTPQQRNALLRERIRQVQEMADRLAAIETRMVALEAEQA